MDYVFLSIIAGLTLWAGWLYWCLLRDPDDDV